MFKSLFYNRSTLWNRHFISGSSCCLIHTARVDHGYSVKSKVHPTPSMAAGGKPGTNYYQRYVNYAPLLFEWSQKINSGRLNMDTLLASKQFRRVSESICDTIRHSDTNILNMLKSVVVMNLDPNLRMVQFLEEELLYKIQYNYDYRLLIATLSLYHRIRDSTPHRKAIFETTIRRINEKLDETPPTFLDLVHLVKFSRYFTPEVLIKIEDQLARYLDAEEETAIPLDNLCYLLVLLSRHNRRNKNLIRSVVAKLLKYRAEEIYTMPPHLVHMISSLKRLNFPEVNLLEKCSDILVNFKFLEHLHESARRDFTVSISNFNFSYPKLKDYYLQTLVEKPELFGHQDLVSLTIMLARLNYQREDLPEIILKHIVPRCNMDNCVSKYQWFNFVNSLLLLRCVPAEHIRSVLQKQFYTEMEHEELESHLNNSRDQQQRTGQQQPEEAVASDNDDVAVSASVGRDDNTGNEVYRTMNIRRKYCLVSGLLRYQTAERVVDAAAVADGQRPLKQFFDSEIEYREFENYLKTFDIDMIKRSKDMQDFRKKLILSFEAFAPSKDRYMCLDVKTPYGFIIDAELKVDDEGKPQIINDPGVLVKGEKPGDEFHRIALMCIGFNETLLDDNQRLIGPKEAELSICRSMGYVVVPIHQNSLPQSTTSLNRVKFLQNRIVSHIKNDDNVDNRK